MTRLNISERLVSFLPHLSDLTQREIAFLLRARVVPESGVSLLQGQLKAKLQGLCWALVLRQGVWNKHGGNFLYPGFMVKDEGNFLYPAFKGQDGGTFLYPVFNGEDGGNFLYLGFIGQDGGNFLYPGFMGQNGGNFLYPGFMGQDEGNFRVQSTTT